MNFSEYQELASKTAIYMNGIKETFPDLPEGVLKLLGLSYTSNGLGEVGEVQGKVKKIIRDSNGIITEDHKKAISKELGDVLWYVSAMCKELDLSMDYIAQENIKKLLKRKENDTLHGSGDDR